MNYPQNTQEAEKVLDDFSYLPYAGEEILGQLISIFFIRKEIKYTDEGPTQADILMCSKYHDEELGYTLQIAKLNFEIGAYSSKVDSVDIMNFYGEEISLLDGVIQQFKKQ